MDERARAARLAGALADRLLAALPAGLEARAEHDAVVVYVGEARSMVIPVRSFGDFEGAVEAAVDVLLAVRDEAEGQARVRYETAAAADGDVVRLWFGRIDPDAAGPPWRNVVPELGFVPLSALLEDGPSASTSTAPAIVTDDRDSYASGMAGVETAHPVRSVTLVGRRTRGYKVDLYRDESGIGLDRRGRRRVLRLGALRLEWYPK